VEKRHLTSVTVTKPFFPPHEEFEAYIKKIWDTGWLTNSGPLVNELEHTLRDYFETDQLLIMTNGTIALQLAIRALDLQGEIITTPFSYVATTSSIVWEQCQPVMVDICPRSLNIDPNKIEQAITDKTSAILATHVFGNPCALDAIQTIAQKHHLKVIYDAAHGFGVKTSERSLLTYGDISICSFHATKLFHTVEGGCVVTQDSSVLKRLSLMRNFGHASLTEFDGVGINGKMSELHAAMGLANFKYLPEILDKRKNIYALYTALLSELPVEFQKIAQDTEYNHAYFPVLFKSEELLLSVMNALALQYIYPRRYFHPSLSQLPYVQGQYTPIADDIANRVLCLPIYHDLEDVTVKLICDIIRETIQHDKSISRKEIVLNEFC
jgi:dTDP-4-amino-4,6-dideoxygalactose transaminase